LLLALFLDGIAQWVSTLTHLGRAWGVTAAILLLLAALAAALWFLGGELVTQVDQLFERLPDYIEAVRRELRASPLGERILNSVDSQGEEGGSSLFRGAVGQATTAGLTVLSFFGNALLVLAIAIFLVIAPPIYRDGALGLTPPSMRSRVETLLDAWAYNLRWWLVGKVVVMLLIGVLTTAGLLLLGVPFALTLGVAAMLLSFVPYFGPLLAFLPALLVALGEGGNSPWYVAGLYGFIQLVESYCIEPLVQQRVVQLPPALTISFQVLAALVLGFLGLMFAVPLLVVIVITVKILVVNGTIGEPVEVPGIDRERLPRAG
jgi:predicted PurR-regulated permease PerM